VGTNHYAPGTLLTCKVTNSPILIMPGTQYICAGWSGTGSVPTQGAGTEATFTLATNTQLTWLWKTQAWFDATASGNGFIDVTNGWLDFGASLSIHATASNYNHFLCWTGNVPAGMQSNPILNLTIAQPLSISALFAGNLTSLGTPEWWLAGYGWTNQFEAASQADFDHDGMPAWEEYVAGTSPIDPASVLQLTLSFENGLESRRMLRWPSVPNHWYSVYRANSLNGNYMRLTNGIPATSPTNIFIDSERGNTWFYRISGTNSP
jgi:hypothetical protein